MMIQNAHNLLIGHEIKPVTIEMNKIQPSAERSWFMDVLNESATLGGGR